jgi:hypothetical protein
MAADSDPTPFLIVRHGRIGKNLDNPSVATVRLSASKESGPHMDFVADAPTLELIAKMLTQAAADIRGRAN